MIYPILKSSDPVVRAVCTPVMFFDDGELGRLGHDLLESLAASKRPGVGLSANQIGYPLRVFVLDFSTMPREGTPPTQVFVNPVISKGRQLKAGLEGCLSCEPSDDRRVLRFNIINWKAQDVNGNHIHGKAHGFLARAIQHEIDHLNGILILDRPKA